MFVNEVDQKQVMLVLYFFFRNNGQECIPPCNFNTYFFNIHHTFLSQFFSETIIQLLFSHYSFNFSGIHVSISPAGSAVIGPQIAQYILLRPATKMKSSLLTSPFTSTPIWNRFSYSDYKTDGKNILYQLLSQSLSNNNPFTRNELHTRRTKKP